MEKKYCQMITDKGIEECGYLVGGWCKSDREHPVRINKWVHDALKVVGCASFSKYLEWSNGRENTVPELPVKQMGSGKDIPQSQTRTEGRLPLSVPVLQEDHSDRGGSTGLKESVGGDMTDCEICGKKAVVKEPDGNNYCEYHHSLWTRCWTHKRMLLNYKEEK
jgi:hypothetical protein